MIIGLPRAGYYFKFKDLWETFFKELGIEVIVSPSTNKEIFRLGMDTGASEFCQPIKIFAGHVAWLKDRVDYIFVPDFLGNDLKKAKEGVEEDFCCSFFRGSSDLMKSLVNTDKIISAELKMDIDNKKEYLRLAKRLKLKKNAKKAYKIALKRQEQYNLDLKNKLGNTLDSKKRKIALIGEAYVINDAFCNTNIIKKLNDLDCDVATSDQISYETINTNAKGVVKTIHWVEERRAIGTLLEFIKDKRIDGIIYITPFNCGPDFLVEELVIKKQNKPILALNVDETLSDARIQTRLEAFCDVIGKKKKGELKTFKETGEGKGR